MSVSAPDMYEEMPEPGEGTAAEAAVDLASCIEELAEALADTVVFKARAHGAHWNVKGPGFGAYHELFGEIYEDADGAIDPLAEQLLKLDLDAPSTLSEFSERSTIKPAPVSSDDPQVLATDLRDMNDMLLDSLEDAYECANDMCETAGLANLLAERIDMHRKWRWQLTRSISNAAEAPVVPPMNPDESLEVEEDAISRARIVSDVELRSNPSLVNELRNNSEDIVERRMIPTKTEIRANADGSWVLSGLAAVYDSQSQDLGNFREVIKRGAFRRILNQPGLNVKALFNHDPNLVLGSTPGTLTLRETPRGLAYEVNVAPTTAGNDLRVLIERGDVTQSSFAFRVGEQAWDDMPDGTLQRTITDFADLLDVSAVTYPAYTDTTAGVRSKDSSTDSSEQAGGTAVQPSVQADESSRRADEEGAHRHRLRRQRLRENRAA